jgi:hypothetical protein
VINLQPLDTLVVLDAYITNELQQAEPRLLDRKEPDLQLENEVRDCLTKQANGMYVSSVCQLLKLCIKWRY